MPGGSVGAYVTPGRRGVKNAVVNPFRRLLHFALGIKGPSGVWRCTIRIRLMWVPPGVGDTEAAESHNGVEWLNKSVFL